MIELCLLALYLFSSKMFCTDYAAVSNMDNETFALATKIESSLVAVKVDGSSKTLSAQLPI
jgi:hypothetical protein